MSLCILVSLSFFSQPPTYISLLLRWHYPTHQTCNFNRGWQGDLDDRCFYGNRWHWQTREAAVRRLCATCAWSDWAHQLSRLPHSLHSQSDGLAQRVCCVRDSSQGAGEEAVRWEGPVPPLFYVFHHNPPCISWLQWVKEIILFFSVRVHQMTFKDSQPWGWLTCKWTNTAITLYTGVYFYCLVIPPR